MPESIEPQPKPATPHARQAKCSHCGHLNDYDPKLVVRSIKCQACGKFFAPGYAHLEVNYVPPHEPATKPNIPAAISVALGVVTAALLFWNLSTQNRDIRSLVNILLFVTAILTGLFATMGILNSQDRGGKGLGLSIAGFLIAAIAVVAKVSLVYLQ